MYLMCVFVIFLSLYVVLIESATPEALLNIYETENDGMGNSKIRFESSDGIKREETVAIVNKNVEDEHVVITGYYYYTSPGGYRVRVDYVADENGYRPKVSMRKFVANSKHRIPSSALASLQGGGLG